MQIRTLSHSDRSLSCSISPRADMCLLPLPGDQVLTVTFHPLVDESIQQRSTVVTEGGAGVRVDLKLVFAPGVLRPRETDKRGHCQ